MSCACSSCTRAAGDRPIDPARPVRTRRDVRCRGDLLSRDHHRAHRRRRTFRAVATLCRSTHPDRTGGAGQRRRRRVGDERKRPRPQLAATYPHPPDRARPSRCAGRGRFFASFAGYRPGLTTAASAPSPALSRRPGLTPRSLRLRTEVYRLTDSRWLLS